MTEEYMPSRRSDMLFDMNNTLGYSSNTFINGTQSTFKVPEKSPSPHQLLELTSTKTNPQDPLGYFTHNNNNNTDNQTGINPNQDDSITQIKQILNATGSSQTSSEYLASSNSSPTQLGSSSFGNDSTSGNKTSLSTNNNHTSVLSQFWPQSTDTTILNPSHDNSSKNDPDYTSPRRSSTTTTFKHSESLALLEDTIERRIPRCSSPLKTSFGMNVGQNFGANIVEKMKESEMARNNNPMYPRGKLSYPNFINSDAFNQQQQQQIHSGAYSRSSYQTQISNGNSSSNLPTPLSSYVPPQAPNPSSAQSNHQSQRSLPVEASRRKNATRENTATLKAWLQEHIKNPYPTKGEKIMLAIITKMTLTQVSTWFANARRRLKKENKMTWSPKVNNGTSQSVTSGNEEDDDVDDDEQGEDDEDEENTGDFNGPETTNQNREEQAKRLKFDHYPRDYYPPSSDPSSYQTFQTFSQLTTSGNPFNNQSNCQPGSLFGSSLEHGTWREDSSALPTQQHNGNAYSSSFAAAMAAITNLNSYHQHNHHQHQHPLQDPGSGYPHAVGSMNHLSSSSFNSPQLTDCSSSYSNTQSHSQKLYENY